MLPLRSVAFAALALVTAVALDGVAPARAQGEARRDAADAEAAGNTEAAADTDAAEIDAADTDAADIDAADTDDELPVFSASGVVAAPIASTHYEDPTATGTVVNLRDRHYAGEELTDVLPEVPGARLIAAGGPGQFVGLRLRGGTLQQTTVLLGDLPLSSPDSGAFDLSLIPVWALERIEVYRGGAPVWYGSGVIGGVLRLVPRVARGSTADLRVSGGSFGTYSASGGLTAATPRLSLVSAIGVSGTRGDFPFDNDRGVPLEPGADPTRDRMRNADNLRSSVLLGATLRLDAGILETTVLMVGRQGGAIGTGLRPGLQTHQTERRLWAASSFTHRGTTRRGQGAYRVQARLAMGIDRSRFHDPLGEVGLAAESTHDRAFLLDGRVAASVDVASHAELTAVTSVQSFERQPYDALATWQEPDSRRIRLDQSLELRLHGGEATRWEVRPSASLTVARGRMQYIHLQELTEANADAVAPTFRVAAVVAPRGPIAIRGSLHHGIRLPSMRELFGDRGALLANPGLRPERSTGVDVGAALCFERGAFALTTDVTLAGDYRDDLIQIRNTSQFTAKAENIDSGLVATAELLVRASLTRHVRLNMQTTYLWSRTSNGAPIPSQPALGLFARPEIGTGALGRHVDDAVLYLAVIHVGSSTMDRAGIERLAGRTPIRLGAMAFFFDRTLFASFEVSDLLDVRGYDVRAYPLPGRRYALQLEYRKDLR